jgi:hypothetical protein
LNNLFSAQVIIIFLLTLLVGSSVFAQTIFTHQTPEAYVSATQSYEVLVLKLALDKTIAEYGPYELRAAPQNSVTRSIQSMKTNAFPNYFASLGYNEEYNTFKEIDYVRFPVDLGVLSYRTCFAPDSMLNEISKINTLDELRKLTMGLGRGWVDTPILQRNGFKVTEVASYTAMFKMTAAHRFDLFCRGVNEIKEEYDRWGSIKGLGYDRHLLIYYPMPILFYTNSGNKEAIERVTKGLLRAYVDGSLLVLWREKHQAGVDFAGLKTRKIFRLENPFLKSIDFDYSKYFYQLDTKKSAR